MPVPVLSPGHASPLAFPPIGRLPRCLRPWLSPALFEASQVICSRPNSSHLPRRLHLIDFPSWPCTAEAGTGEVRSPRFRHLLFMRNGVSDHGRAVTPCVAVHNILPSTFSTASASARLNFSRLNIPLHMIAVYASRPSSPAAPQHSLEGGSLLPYPHRTFTGWKAPASPGALCRFSRRPGSGRLPSPSSIRGFDVIVGADDRRPLPRLQPGGKRAARRTGHTWRLGRPLNAALRTDGCRPVQVVEALNCTPRACVFGAKFRPGPSCIPKQ